MSLTTRIAVITADVLVLLVTWSKTAKSYREARRLGISAPLVTLLFRDGEWMIVIVYPFYILNRTCRDVLLRVSLSHSLNTADAE